MAAPCAGVPGIVGAVCSLRQRSDWSSSNSCGDSETITAAVDETALAADSMSNTIAAIRSDTEGVATSIAGVEKDFEEFTSEIDKFGEASSAFAKSVAR